jgi:hypothetical protein
MLKNRHQKQTKNLVTLLGIVLCLVCLAWDESQARVAVSRPQSSKRKITEQPWHMHALRVVKVKFGDKEVNPNEEFENGDEWFKGFTVILRNVTTKDIKYFDFMLDFPETEATGLLLTSGSLPYGRYPKIWEHGDKILLKPGEEAEIKISDIRYAALIKSIETHSQPIKNLTTLDILIGQVRFSDGTIWYAGEMMRIDPNTGNWVPIR